MPCTECPWIKKGPHSDSWKKHADKMCSRYETKIHSCHMKSKDTWGKNGEVEYPCKGHQQSKL